MKVFSMVVLLAVIISAAWLDCARSSTRRGYAFAETAVPQQQAEQPVIESHLAESANAEALGGGEDWVEVGMDGTVDLSLYAESLDFDGGLRPDHFVAMIQDLLSRTLPPEMVNVQAECWVVLAGQQVSSFNCLLFNGETAEVEEAVTQESAVHAGVPPSLWEIDTLEFEQQ